MSEPLVFKYIPKEFDEIVGVDTSPFKKMIDDPLSMPSLLFYGPKGTGKSTTARLIVDKLSPVNVLKINGSSERGIDTVRTKVEMFVSSAGSVLNKPKIVWIEEFDNMSQDAFKSLRALIEQYAKNARFVCTANYINKIPEEIQSRFTLYKFDKLSTEDILPRARFICDNEGINVSDVVLRNLIDYCNGDVRSVIKNIQKLSFEDKTISEEKLLNMRSVIDIAYEKLLEGNWSFLRLELPKKSPDYNELFVSLNDKFFMSDLQVEKKARITEIISDTFFQMAFSFDKDICASAAFYKIIKVLKE